jgi:hypothetical protein
VFIPLPEQCWGKQGSRNQSEQYCSEHSDSGPSLGDKFASWLIVVVGPWSLDRGCCTVAIGPWSLDRGRWTVVVVRGHWTVVVGPGSL